MPADERVDIFSHFEDKNSNLFINEAEKIFKKYKNNCNAIVTNK